MVVVLAIVALVLGAVWSVAQGALTLADDARRAQLRDGRMQAFSSFCERLMTDLPATAVLNLKTTEGGGQYLTTLELNHVPSPFDGAPNCRVTLSTEPMPGGYLCLMLSLEGEADERLKIRTKLFEDLSECGWRVFDATTRQWMTVWTENAVEKAEHIHPLLLEWTAAQGAETQRRVYWIAPNEPVSTGTR
jgi:hypothetical protein